MNQKEEVRRKKCSYVQQWKEKVRGRSFILRTYDSSITLVKGKKSKTIGIRSEGSTNKRAFVQRRVNENDLSISPKACVYTDESNEHTW